MSERFDDSWAALSEAVNVRRVALCVCQQSEGDMQPRGSTLSQARSCGW